MRHGYLILIWVFTLALGAIYSPGAQASGPPSGSVWAWGYNYDGELGNGTLTTASPYSSSHPVQVVDPIGTSYLAGVTALAGGTAHSLALKSDGTIWAWGINGNGQLGNNSTNNSDLPVQVQDPSDASGYLTHVSTIAGGYQHSLALKSDDTVRAWGWNDNGQLGNGTFTTSGSQGSSHPVQVKDPSDASGYLTHVTALVAGAVFSLALKSDGTVRAWGDNSTGQLGNNTTSNSSLPVQVQDPTDPSGYLTHVVAIATGLNHCLALKSDGTVWAWGLTSLGN